MKKKTKSTRLVRVRTTKSQKELDRIGELERQIVESNKRLEAAEKRIKELEKDNQFPAPFPSLPLWPRRPRPADDTPWEEPPDNPWPRPNKPNPWAPSWPVRPFDPPYRPTYILERDIVSCNDTSAAPSAARKTR